MAITKILHQKASPDRELGLHTKQLIDYILNPDKTEQCILTGSVNCLPDTAYDQMVETKKMFGKPGGRQSYHIIISLVPGEGMPEQLYEMTEKFVAEFLHGEYEVVFAVHTDHEHLHSHIVFNSVNMVTGRKFQYKNGDWKHKMQPITNKLSEEYGLEIMPAEYSKDPKNMSRVEWERQNSISLMVEADARYCRMIANDREHYIYLLEALGYEVKDGEHISVKADGMKKYKRLGTIAPELDYKENHTNNSDRDHSYSVEMPEYNTVDPRPIKRADMSYIQKKYYRRLYKLRLIEKRRFTYKSSKFYEDMKLFNKLQEEYLLLVDEKIETIDDLWNLSIRLNREIDDVSLEQKELYRERNRFKKMESKGMDTDSCRFLVAEDEIYKGVLESCKIQKKELKKKMKLTVDLIDEFFDYDKYKALDNIPLSYNENELNEAFDDDIPQIVEKQVESKQEVATVSEDDSSVVTLESDINEKSISESAQEEMEETEVVKDSNEYVDEVVSEEIDYSEAVNTSKQQASHYEYDIDAEMIAIDALIYIQTYDLNIQSYLGLTLDERASLWDITSENKELGFEAYRIFVTSAGVDWSVPKIYEEYQKHYNKCLELREEPWMKEYYLKRLKNDQNNQDKKLVREKYPHIR